MTAPIIFIGSGINSLVAAADLAARGRAVHVLERAAYAGGAVNTRELTVPGYLHDFGAMNLSTFVGSPFMQRHGKRLAELGLEFIHVPRPFAQALEPGDFVGITTTPEETLASFQSDQDRQRWRQLMAEFPEQIDVLGRLLSSPATPLSLARLGWHALRKLGGKRSASLLRFLLSSPRAWLEENFEDPRLRTALSSWGMHLDFSPDIAGGALFPYLEGVGGQLGGMFLPRGGAGSVVQALVRMIESHGGQLSLNTEVQRILHQGGRVQGVVTGQGELHSAQVVANLAPRHLLRLMGGSGDRGFDQGLARFRHAPGTMMIHAAAQAPIPWLAPQLRNFAYVHIARSVDAAAGTYVQALAGKLPAEPVLVVGQPSVFDPSRAPADGQALWIQVRMVPARILGDAAAQIQSTDWSLVKEQMAERVFDLIEEQAPGFRSHLIARTVFSPLDLEAANPNLVGGDQVCGSHHLSQNFMFRPMNGRSDGSTPIAGLHLVGAAVWPGGGTGAGSGFLLAQKL